MARQGTPFDEIMIVNPINYQRQRRMKFYPINSLRGYVEDGPFSPGNMAYVADDPFHEDATMGYVAEGPYQPMGYISDPPPGFVEGFNEESDDDYGMSEFADCEDSMGYVNDCSEMGYFADDMEDDETGMSYFADADSDEDDEGEMGYFADDGLDEDEDEDDDEMGYFADDEDEYDEETEMGYFADDVDDDDDEVAGYEPEIEPAFNQRCLPVSKVNGVGEYIKPKSINPTCTSIRPAETVIKTDNGWFKPIW